MDKKKLQNTIQLCRQEKGLTQEELAACIGVTRQTIISIEKGNYTPSLMLALAFSKQFNKKVDELFWLE